MCLWWEMGLKRLTIGDQKYLRGKRIKGGQEKLSPVGIEDAELCKIKNIPPPLPMFSKIHVRLNLSNSLFP